MHSTALIYELMHFLSQERGLLLLDGMRLQSLEDPLGVDAPCDVSWWKAPPWFQKVTCAIRIYKVVCHSVVTIGPKTLQKVKCHHLRAGAQDLHVDLQMCHSSIPSFKNLQTDRCSFHTSWQRVCNKRVGILWKQWASHAPLAYRQNMDSVMQKMIREIWFHIGPTVYENIFHVPKGSRICSRL